MKKTGNPNINTKTYWNTRYIDREAYALETGTQRFLKAMEHIKEGDRVLDIGCGIGTFTNLVKEAMPDCEVWGVDISSKAIEQNIKEHTGITYRQHTIGQKPPFPKNYFDFIFSGEVLEHIDHPEDLFNEAHKALKPGGIFMISTPNGDSIKTDEHVWEFNQDDIEDMYYSTGFNNIDFIYLPNLEHLLVIMAMGIKA